MGAWGFEAFGIKNDWALLCVVALFLKNGMEWADKVTTTVTVNTAKKRGTSLQEIACIFHRSRQKDT